jgi:hypothetical protein
LTVHAARFLPIHRASLGHDVRPPVSMAQ